ncbi:radical SAM protein [Anaeromyxobacter diazotrophicus]|uniref:Radical SAM protein n=1 Tax=Anaeromyxobacter diazotrophicus TaxID=2590199 RepID=A0A7I9VLB4_9BACT|nr:radical SAM protein [Anaeromyxobacter diazotrophicus]GEJ56910.1 radical SAM protein [Anaeromyxobacter diazotrophicus]
MRRAGVGPPPPGAAPLERGAVRKDPGGKLRVALVYPNTYRVGMANLGLHAVYRLFNAHPRTACERAFLPEAPDEAPRTVESGQPLADNDVVAFSLSFEEDYRHVLALLDRAGLPLRAADRDARHPLVVAGGIAVQINPEPVAPFFDLLLVGEGEELCAPFLDQLAGGARDRTRPALLAELARLPGSYVPSLYEVEYADTAAPAGAWVTRFEPKEGAPARVVRRYVEDLRTVPTSRVVDSPDAQFGDLFLTEVARGCLWGCRFCAAGFVQRPYREVDLETLRAEARRGLAAGLRVGLVGPDTSDYSGLDALTCSIAEEGGTFSPSSLRVDAITPALAGRMAAGGERSITLAPEAGTERLRRVINKDFPDDLVVKAAEHALGQGMQHVKMYFMCGLPTETDEDVLGMARLAVRIREEVMLPRAKATGRMGRLSLSVNPFIPKPWTPFQWAPMAERGCLEAKRKLLERELRPRGIDVEMMSPREAFLQALLSRGDRRVADLLELAHREAGGDLRKALARWGHAPEYFASREIGVDEALPWDFLDQGLTKKYLARELRRGVGAKVTPKCQVETCRACGLACADHPELLQPLRPPALAAGPLAGG